MKTITTATRDVALKLVKLSFEVMGFEPPRFEKFIDVSPNPFVGRLAGGDTLFSLAGQAHGARIKNFAASTITFTHKPPSGAFAGKSLIVGCNHGVKNSESAYLWSQDIAEVPNDRLKTKRAVLKKFGPLTVENRDSKNDIIAFSTPMLDAKDFDYDYVKKIGKIIVDPSLYPNNGKASLSYFGNGLAKDNILHFNGLTSNVSKVKWDGFVRIDATMARQRQMLEEGATGLIGRHHSSDFKLPVQPGDSGSALISSSHHLMGMVNGISGLFIAGGYIVMPKYSRFGWYGARVEKIHQLLGYHTRDEAENNFSEPDYVNDWRSEDYDHFVGLNWEPQYEAFVEGEVPHGYEMRKYIPGQDDDMWTNSIVNYDELPLFVANMPVPTVCATEPLRIEAFTEDDIPPEYEIIDGSTLSQDELQEVWNNSIIVDDNGTTLSDVQQQKLKELWDVLEKYYDKVDLPSFDKP